MFPDGLSVKAQLARLEAALGFDWDDQDWGIVNADGARVVEFIDFFEQNYDERGILWPDALAPFQIALVPMKYETEVVREATDNLYAELTAAGYEVLLDDRDKKTSPGVKFADMELIGIPHRIVIGERGLHEGKLEYRCRRDAESTLVDQGGVVDLLLEKLCAS